MLFTGISCITSEDRMVSLNIFPGNSEKNQRGTKIFIKFSDIQSLLQRLVLDPTEDSERGDILKLFETEFFHFRMDNLAII